MPAAPTKKPSKSAMQHQLNTLIIETHGTTVNSKCVRCETLDKVCIRLLDKGTPSLKCGRCVAAGKTCSLVGAKASTVWEVSDDDKNDSSGNDEDDGYDTVKEVSPGPSSRKRAASPTVVVGAKKPRSTVGGWAGLRIPVSKGKGKEVKKGNDGAKLEEKLEELKGDIKEMRAEMGELLERMKSFQEGMQYLLDQAAGA